MAPVADAIQPHPRPSGIYPVRQWVVANDPAVYPSPYRILAEGIDEIVVLEPPVSCPALIVTGDEDYGNGPQMSHAIAAEIKGATTVTLRGPRHMALVERPEVVNTAIVSFLAAHQGVKTDDQ